MLGGSSGVSNTAALFMGGYLPSGAVSADTEQWNGTSWTELANLTTARQSTGGAGTSTLAICISGYNGAPNNVATSEEWDAQTLTVKTVTVS